MTQKFNHREAYCLMRYQCESCRIVEVLWNSRDGVTPFTVSCRTCKGSMVHIDWSSDVRAVDHVPQPKQRIFIDTPKSLVALVARWQVAQADGTPREVKGGRREKIIQEIIDEFRDEEPWIIEWPG